MIQSYEEAQELLSTNEGISFENSFNLSNYCSRLLTTNDSGIGRDLLISIIDKLDYIDQNTYPIWNDLLSAYGLYPYINTELLGDSNTLRFEFHKSKFLENVYFHEEQLKIANDLLSKKSVVLSAPTSFGKSLLIQEVIASGIYKNIVIVQPTLALIDETRKKSSKYKEKYKIIVSTKQEPAKLRGNLFIFTAERVVEFKKFSSVDFFVIDEFYKLSLERDDDRAIALNHAFYKLLKLTNKFYMLGPMIKSIPSKFSQNYDFHWYHTNFRTVVVEEKKVSLPPKANKDDKQKVLFDLLFALKDPTLIYCSSPNKANTLASYYLEYLIEKVSDNVSHDNRDIIEWLEENVHNDWSLIKCLKNKIGFHHGALPRHLGSSIVDSFNSYKVQYLFCTSTLIEGVNTSAKNIILFDKKKGPKKLDYFDYKNIAGRSGRMSQFYIGYIYNFHEEPTQLELDVDIPAITQENAPPELLIHIDDKELTEKSREKIEEFSSQNSDLKKILRENSGISIKGQLELISELESKLHYYNQYLIWTSFAKYNQLRVTLELAWKYLINPNDSKAGIRSAAELATLTIKYTMYKSLSGVILDQMNSDYWRNREPDSQKRVDTLSFKILNVARLWFDYKLPKILLTISIIQRYVFERNGLKYGDYKFLASQLELGFIDESFSELLEYDIPKSAVKKIEKFYGSKISLEEFKSLARRGRVDNVGFNEYEKKKIKDIG